MTDITFHWVSPCVFAEEWAAARRASEFDEIVCNSLIRSGVKWNLEKHFIHMSVLLVTNLNCLRKASERASKSVLDLE